MGVRVFDGQVDDLAEEFFPQLRDDAQAQLGAEYALHQAHGLMAHLANGRGLAISTAACE